MGRCSHRYTRESFLSCTCCLLDIWTRPRIAVILKYRIFSLYGRYVDFCVSEDGYLIGVAVSFGAAILGWVWALKDVEVDCE